MSLQPTYAGIVLKWFIGLTIACGLTDENIELMADLSVPDQLMSAIVQHSKVYLNWNAYVKTITLYVFMNACLVLVADILLLLSLPSFPTENLSKDFIF